MIAMLHAVMHVTYRVNATISGMCVNLLGLAISPLILQMIWHQRNSSARVNAFSPLRIGVLEKVPVIGAILNQQNIFILSGLHIYCGWLVLYVSHHPGTSHAYGRGKSPGCQYGGN